MFLRSATVRTSGVETAPLILSSAVAGAVCANASPALATIRTSEIPSTANRDTPALRSIMRVLLDVRNVESSGLFQHHFCGLDHRGHGIANLELHFVRAALGYYAFDQVLAHAHDYMSHDAAKLDFDNFSFEPISC